MNTRQPDPKQLVAAVRDSLQKLAARTEGGIAYELRVAARALDIVERELHNGGDAEAIEADALRTLHRADLPLPELRAAVCEALRDGGLAADAAEVLRALRRIAEVHLSIDNPDFASLPGTGGDTAKE